jgi:Rho GTPase-activating protein 22/24/25
VKKFKKLEDPNHTLLQWLVDLVSDVAALEQINKMNPRNLAIVIAPNLYCTPPGTDPIEGLMISQKVVDFVLHLVRAEIRSRGEQ